MRDENQIETGRLRQARRLAVQLKGLGHEPAPRSLAANALSSVSLVDEYWPVDTLIGPLFVVWNGEGISALLQARSEEAFEETFEALIGRGARRAVQPPASLLRWVGAELNGRGGRPPRFDLRALKPFQRAVLLKALEIPRGEVRPYGWIAREIGLPRAVRAVGTALANNPIPLLIPCHRVVRTDGRIGNYAFGSAAKRALLKAEGAEPEELERLARRGVRYVGSRTNGVYCYPTCRHARRIQVSNRVAFTSSAETSAAGYRPCRTCRPEPAERAS